MLSLFFCRLCLRTVLGAVLALCAAGAARAQSETGTIQGRVFSVDSEGNRFSVPGAEIELSPVTEEEAAAGEGARQGAADASGEFRFEGLPFGCYLITASAADLVADPETACVSAEDSTVTVEIKMELAVVEEQIEVTAARPEDIQPTQTTSQETVDAETMNESPILSEQYRDALVFAPGVLKGPEGNINIQGAASSDSGALVDGADVTNPFTGESAVYFPIDVVGEMNILSSPFDAQYGKFSGAVEAVQTKPSNFDDFKLQFHNMVPRLRIRDGAFVGLESVIPRVTMTGPLVDDKVAFTQSLEYRFLRDDTERANLPQLKRDTQNEAFNSFTRMDFQIDDGHTAHTNFVVYPRKQNFFGLNTFTTQEASPNLRRRGYMAAGRDSYTFTSGSLAETSASFQVLENDVRANSGDPFRVFLDTSLGGFFDHQRRRTERFEASETYHVRPLTAAGTHTLKMGGRLTRNTYDGVQRLDTVNLLGAGDRLVQRVEFGPQADLAAEQTEFAAFVQNKWNVNPRLTFDFGARFDRDTIADESNVAPRAGFALVLTSDQRTLLRGGAGVFYNRVTLNVPTFPDIPERTEIRFGPDGGVIERTAYRHRLTNDIEVPRSIIWNAQLDRAITRNILLRLGVQQRTTTRKFIVHQRSEPAGDFLEVENSGRDRYQAFEVTTRVRLDENNTFLASYVNSDSRGDLNSFDSLFGGVTQALIRPNELSRLPFDAQHRFLFRGQFQLFWKLIVSPVWDIHSGFPISIRNEQRDFISPRNGAGRFPAFSKFDLQILREVKLPFLNKKPLIGVKLFNLLNNTNPNDFQNVTASPNFGIFTNFKNRALRGRIMFDF